MASKDKLQRKSQSHQCKCGKAFKIYTYHNPGFLDNDGMTTIICRRCFSEQVINIPNAETATISGGIIVV